MSIRYYALPVRDRDLLGPILEGTSTAGHRIDGDAVRAAVQRRGFTGRDRGTLRWDGEGSYVFVDVFADHAIVTHGTGGGDEEIDRLVDAVGALKACGLHVWDPQQGSWFFPD